MLITLSVRWATVTAHSCNMTRGAWARVILNAGEIVPGFLVPAPNFLEVFLAVVISIAPLTGRQIVFQGTIKAVMVTIFSQKVPRKTLSLQPSYLSSLLQLLFFIYRFHFHLIGWRSRWWQGGRVYKRAAIFVFFQWVWESYLVCCFY